MGAGNKQQIVLYTFYEKNVSSKHKGEAEMEMSESRRSADLKNSVSFLVGAWKRVFMVKFI